MRKHWWYILKLIVVISNLLIAAWDHNYHSMIGWLMASVYVACDTPEDTNHPSGDKI